MLNIIQQKLTESPLEYAILFVLCTILVAITIERIVHLVRIHKEFKLALIELATKYKTPITQTITQTSTPITQTDTQTDTPVTVYDYFITQLQTSNWSNDMKGNLKDCVYKPSVSRQVHWYSDTFVSYVINGRGNVKVLNITNSGYVYAISNDNTMRKGFFIKIGNISYFLLDTK